MEILRTTSPRALLGALTAGVLLSLLPACGSVADLTAPKRMEERVVVHSVLQAGTDTVSVVLSITSGYSLPDYPPPARSLSGATVRLVAGGDTIPLVEQKEVEDRCGIRLPHAPHRLGAGCYLAALPGGVQAGATYELIIDTVVHGIIRGSATVPTAPALLEPIALTELTVSAVSYWMGDVRDPVPLRWQRAEPGWRVELTLRARDEGCRVGFVVGRWHGENSGVDISGLDSASLHSRRIFCPGRELDENYLADIYLTAYDSAYTAYISHQRSYGSTPWHRAAFGVEGALGVFAGAATTTVPVTLVVQQDTTRLSASLDISVQPDPRRP